MSDLETEVRSMLLRRAEDVDVDVIISPNISDLNPIDHVAAEPSGSRGRILAAAALVLVFIGGAVFALTGQDDPVTELVSQPEEAAVATPTAAPAISRTPDCTPDRSLCRATPTVHTLSLIHI